MGRSMRLLGKFSLVLLFLAFPSILPSSSQGNLCGLIARSSDIKDFGRNGQNGVNGKDGSKGQESETLTIFADGSPATLNLAGQQGADGVNGSDGINANCGNQPEKAENNFQAANGGDGGNGGNGGDGGSGGKLTIYATDPNLLSQIKVNANGGEGGQPGQGGIGGQGCNCTKPYWTIETCEGDPGDEDYSCTSREFRCLDGKNGANGSNGRQGRNGALGTLTLVNSDKPLQKDQPSATIAISELKNTGYILSQNIWETRSGALALFAPGSVIEDRYRALSERVERSFLLIWNAPQAFNQFAEKRVTLSLDENKNIKLSLPDDLWLEATTQQQNNITQLVVYNAMQEDEATRLKSEGLSGTGSNLKLTLVDEAERSDMVATKFRLKYRITRSDPRFQEGADFRTKYDGELPIDSIVANGDRFTLNLGKLPIEADALRSGTGVQLDLVATRSFAGYSAEQKIVVKDVLGPFK
jgi:hypothetical protein